MKKRKIVIYVPGASYISTSSKPLKIIVKMLYNLVRTRPNYNSAKPKWLTKKTLKCDKIVIMHWKENINPFAEKKAVKKLEKIIEYYQNKAEIYLVGTSLGGDIVSTTAEEINNSSIKKILLVGSINKRKCIALKGKKIINLVSFGDTLQRLGIRAFAPFRGSVLMKGPNVKNIVVQGLRHDQLHENKAIPAGKYKGQKLDQIIEKTF